MFSNSCDVYISEELRLFFLSPNYNFSKSHLLRGRVLLLAFVHTKCNISSPFLVKFFLQWCSEKLQKLNNMTYKLFDVSHLKKHKLAIVRLKASETNGTQIKAQVLQALKGGNYGGLILKGYNCVKIYLSSGDGNKILHLLRMDGRFNIILPAVKAPAIKIPIPINLIDSSNDDPFKLLLVSNKILNDRGVRMEYAIKGKRYYTIFITISRYIRFQMDGSPPVVHYKDQMVVYYESLPFSQCFCCASLGHSISRCDNFIEQSTEWESNKKAERCLLCYNKTIKTDDADNKDSIHSSFFFLCPVIQSKLEDNLGIIDFEYKTMSIEPFRWQ